MFSDGRLGVSIEECEATDWKAWATVAHDLLLQRCQDRRQAGRDREPREVREGHD
jgi:hypothetical protein